MKTWTLAIVLLTGCLPRERLNASCQWTPDTMESLDLSNPAHRTHLVNDVRIAEELGIRHGDSFTKTLGVPAAQLKREQCTETLMATIASRHGVARNPLEQFRNVRDVHWDVLFIYLPLVALFAFASRHVTRWVLRGFDPEDRWPRAITLAVMAPAIAGAGVMVARLWEWTVDSARLWDSHLSYRAAYLPISSHAFIAWLGALVLFVLVSLSDRYSRRPATRR